LRPLTEDEIIEGSTLIGHKIADDNMIVLMDPLEDHDDILRANRSRERQFVFDMVFDAKSTQVIIDKAILNNFYLLFKR
jgi:kinesin family member 18/19